MSRTAPRRLAVPVAVAVQAGTTGYPHAVDGSPIDAVRESWMVEDRWWSPEPVRRRYWEVVTHSGKNLVLYRDLRTGQWFRQASMS